MDFVIIAITVIFGAGLTFFSEFGLGTILLPVFSLFFDYLQQSVLQLLFI